MNATATVPARNLQPGWWMVFDNPRFNSRITEVSSTRDGDMRIHHDFGNAESEPATSFFEPDEMVLVSTNGIADS
jgi:hypothetical protein